MPKKRSSKSGNRDADTIHLVNEALAEQDLQQLRKLASVRGLVSNSLRERCWAVLGGAAGATPVASADYERWASVDHRDRHVVRVDVERSLFTLMHNVTPEELAAKRVQLQRLLNAAIGRHAFMDDDPSWHLASQPSRPGPAARTGLNNRKSNLGSSPGMTDTPAHPLSSDLGSNSPDGADSHRAPSAPNTRTSSTVSKRRFSPASLLCMSQAPSTLSPAMSLDELADALPAAQPTPKPSTLRRRFGGCLGGPDAVVSAPMLTGNVLTVATPSFLATSQDSQSTGHGVLSVEGGSGGKPRSSGDSNDMASAASQPPSQATVETGSAVSVPPENGHVEKRASIQGTAGHAGATGAGQDLPTVQHDVGHAQVSPAVSIASDAGRSDASSSTVLHTRFAIPALLQQASSPPPAHPPTPPAASTTSTASTATATTPQTPAWPSNRVVLPSPLSSRIASVSQISVHTGDTLQGVGDAHSETTHGRPSPSPRPQGSVQARVLLSNVSSVQSRVGTPLGSRDGGPLGGGAEQHTTHPFASAAAVRALASPSHVIHPDTCSSGPPVDSGSRVDRATADVAAHVAVPASTSLPPAQAAGSAGGSISDSIPRSAPATGAEEASSRPTEDNDCEPTRGVEQQEGRNPPPAADTASTRPPAAVHDDAQGRDHVPSANAEPLIPLPDLVRKPVAGDQPVLRRPSSQTAYYYQGLHDIASVLLLVCGSEAAAFPLLCRLVGLQLKDASRADLTPVMEILDLLYPLLTTVDPGLAAHLKGADLPPFFAVSWLITWFAHDVRDLAVAARLFDLFLASHPLMPLYVGVALMVDARTAILECEEMPELHRLLTNLQVTCYKGSSKDRERSSRTGSTTASSPHAVDALSAAAAAAGVIVSPRTSMDAGGARRQGIGSNRLSGAAAVAHAAALAAVDGLIMHALRLYRAAPPAQLVKKHKFPLVKSVSPAAQLQDNHWWVPDVPPDAHKRALAAQGALNPLQRMSRLVKQLGNRGKVEPRSLAGGSSSAAAASRGGSVFEGGPSNASREGSGASAGSSASRSGTSRVRTALQIGSVVGVYLVAAFISYAATWGNTEGEGADPAPST